jgi:hypothetical protein
VRERYTASLQVIVQSRRNGVLAAMLSATVTQLAVLLTEPTMIPCRSCCCYCCRCRCWWRVVLATGGLTCQMCHRCAQQQRSWQQHGCVCVSMLRRRSAACCLGNPGHRQLVCKHFIYMPLAHSSVDSVLVSLRVAHVSVQACMCARGGLWDLLSMQPVLCAFTCKSIFCLMFLSACCVAAGGQL